MGGEGTGDKEQEKKERRDKRREVRGSVQPIPQIEKQLSTTSLDVSQHKKKCRSVQLYHY